MSNYTWVVIQEIRTFRKSKLRPSLKLHIYYMYLRSWLTAVWRGYAFHPVHGGPFTLNDPIWIRCR